MERVPPSSLGMSVRAGAAVHTGTRGRVLLRLDEGSHVKLGENALFSVDSFERPSRPDGVFQGLFNVLRGAFRYSTTLLSRQSRRRIDIRISAVTAGIRGTDIWGKAAPDRDIVCLIEGAVEVRRGEDAPISMSDPLSFYIAPKGEPALPVKPVAAEQLERWARETDIDSSEGGITGSGEWSAHLKSFASRLHAEAAVQELLEAGYPASLRQVRANGKRWFRVSIEGLSSVEGARNIASELEGQFRIRGTWVSRTR